MPSTRKESGGRKKTTGTRRPSRARSATATAERPKQESGQKGTALLDTLYKRLEGEGVEFEKSPNKSGTYTRLRIDGKAFAYVFPPRPNSVAVKIPKQLLSVASKLPKDHGFARTDWGLTRTIKAAADATSVAKSLKVAAEAVRPKQEEESAAAAAS